MSTTAYDGASDVNERKDKPPVPAGYEPTAFASEGTKVTLSIGDERIGDVACYAHDGEVYPHMALRGVNEQWENWQDLINRAITESGGSVTEPILKDPITGMFHRLPTEEELEQLRGSKGLIQIIYPEWEHSLDAHHAKCDRRRFA